MTRSVPVAMILLVVLAALVALPSRTDAGASHDKVVNGYVKDNAGNPYAGVTVMVTIDGNSHSEETNSAGFYDLQFLAAEWTVGSTIFVLAEASPGDQQSTSELADDSFVQSMDDLIFPYEIPEMGTPIGLIVAGVLVGAVAVVVITFVRRR